MFLGTAFTPGFPVYAERKTDGIRNSGGKEMARRPETFESLTAFLAYEEGFFQKN